MTNEKGSAQHEHKGAEAPNHDKDRDQRPGSGHSEHSHDGKPTDGRQGSTKEHDQRGNPQHQSHDERHKGKE